MPGSRAGFAARTAAAAFVLGLSLGAPQAVVGSVAVAAADSPDTAAGAADAGTAGATESTRTTRGPKTTTRGVADRAKAPRAAAAVEAAATESKSGVSHTRARRTAARPTTTETVPHPPVATDSPVAGPTPADMTAQPAASATVVTPSISAPVPVRLSAAAPAAPDPVAVAPSALATASVPTGAAATSFADVLDGLLGPIQAFFEGAILLVRRTFFNQAPNLSPIQLTGQAEGPITGSLGAVDPEGDRMVYALTGDPRFGSVVIAQDGTFTYTPGADFTGTDSFVVTATDTGFHINLLDLFRPAGTSASVAVNQGALAALLRFQFVYGSGSQFWSSEARSALESAATQLSSYFVLSSPVTITFEVTGEFSPLSSTLASAGSDFVNPGAGFMKTVVQSKVQTGIDANGSTADGTISWNFGPSWGFGNSVGGGQYDFQSTAMHELLHTFGFLSYVDRAGANTGTTWTVFDDFLVNSSGAAVIGGDYTWNTAYNPNLTGGSGGLYFGGPNAVAAYGGLVPLYTPSQWASGSSVSHLNDAVFSGARDKLMTAVKSQGQGLRVLSSLELAILEDIGFQVVPGPAGATLMLVGFFVIRRRPTKH